MHRRRRCQAASRRQESRCRAERRTQQADILIAGGGYVGLTLALALVREIGAGLRIAVIERGQEPPPAAGAGNGDPRASAISASSRQLLSALGLWAALEPDAVPVARIEITDTGLDAGVRRSLLSYDNVAGDGEPASWIVPNGALAAALDGAVRGTPAIVRHFGVERHRPRHRHGRAADIALDDGRHVVASLAIAADGRRSALREAAGIKTVGWDYDQTGIVTTIAHELDHGNRAIQHFLPGGPFALLPLNGGHRSCITWSETASEADAHHGARRRRLPRRGRLARRRPARRGHSSPGRAGRGRSRRISPAAMSGRGWRWSAMPRTACIRSAARGSTSASATSPPWSSASPTR